MKLASMMNWKTYSILLCAFFVLQNQALADDAKLTNINVSNTRDDLLIYLTLEGAFGKKLEEAVLSGVQATFSFYVSLSRARAMWFDKKIASIKLTHTIKYDNLKKKFSVKRSWKDNESVVTQSFEQAQRLMTEVDSLKVHPLSGLEKGGQYQIRAKAEVSKLKLPFYLHFFLFSLWDVETDWYTIDFIY